MTCKEFAKIFESIAPLDSGVPGDDLGFIWGDPEKTVTGIGCTWCVQKESILRCAEKNINLIICHESPWLPYQESHWYESVDADKIFSNDLRKKLLDKHDIIVYRSHSNWDALREHGIADSAVACLGIKGLRTVAGRKFYSVNELPSPMSVSNLMDIVKKALNYADCRIFGDKNKQIKRFAFLIGGFGENQFHIPQRAAEAGAEAVIIGEMSEFILLSCLEMDIPVIETLHSASEIPGIKNQALLLKRLIPDIHIEYIPSGAANIT